MFKIIADSCCDLINAKKLFEEVPRVPLHLLVNGKDYTDDRNINLDQLLTDIDASPEVPKTQCPAPDSYLQAIKDSEEDEIFIVTLTSKLSGSYNSALLAVNLYLEEYNDKKIHVFDSRSASAGELAIVNRIYKLIDEGCSFNTIVEKIEYYIKNECTLYALLENLDTLAKNGRLTKMQSMLTSLAKIKLVLTAKEGEIVLKAKAMTMGQGIAKAIKEIQESGLDLSNRTLFISHCDALELAETFKRKALIKCDFKNIEIFNTSGLSSVYANRGGIIVAF
jgi:DegV family protein with EDD domain